MIWLRDNYIQYKQEKWQETDNNKKLIAKFKIFDLLDKWQDNYPLFIHEVINLLRNCSTSSNDHFPLYLPVTLNNTFFRSLCKERNATLHNHLQFEEIITHFMYSNYDPYLLSGHRETLLNYYIKHYISYLSFDLIKQMINYGFDPNLVNIYGQTPLSLCLYKLGENVNHNIDIDLNLEKITKLFLDLPNIDLQSSYNTNSENYYYSSSLMYRSRGYFYKELLKKGRLETFVSEVSYWQRFLCWYAYKLNKHSSPSSDFDLQKFEQDQLATGRLILEEEISHLSPTNKNGLWQSLFWNPPINIENWINLLNQFVPISENKISIDHISHDVTSDQLSFLKYFLIKGGKIPEKFYWKLLEKARYQSKIDVIQTFLQHLTINSSCININVQQAAKYGQFDVVEVFIQNISQYLTVKTMNTILKNIDKFLQSHSLTAINDLQHPIEIILAFLINNIGFNSKEIANFFSYPLVINNSQLTHSIVQQNYKNIEANPDNILTFLRAGDNTSREFILTKYIEQNLFSDQHPLFLVWKNLSLTPKQKINDFNMILSCLNDPNIVINQGIGKNNHILSFLILENRTKECIDTQKEELCFELAKTILQHPKIRIPPLIIKDLNNIFASFPQILQKWVALFEHKKVIEGAVNIPDQNSLPLQSNSACSINKDDTLQSISETSPIATLTRQSRVNTTRLLDQKEKKARKVDLIIQAQVTPTSETVCLPTTSSSISSNITSHNNSTNNSKRKTKSSSDHTLQQKTPSRERISNIKSKKELGEKNNIFSIWYTKLLYSVKDLPSLIFNLFNKLLSIFK